MRNRTLFFALACTMLVTMPASARSELLKPCPDSPNCVSSQAADDQHFIMPFRYTGPAGTAWQLVIEVLQAARRTAIVEQTDSYLHAESTSLVFRFVDDVEFLLQPEEQLIQVRSASRSGYSDFGVNRRRVEKLRRGFEQALQATQE